MNTQCASADQDPNWTGSGWSLRILTPEQFAAPGVDLQPGDCCFSPYPTNWDDWPKESYADWPFHLVKPTKLGSNYFARNAHRKPIIVWLPGGNAFCIDGRATRDGIYYGDGWEVSGDPYLGTLTVKPSINMNGCYHGYLTNNRISPDCEGRKHDPRTGQRLP